MKGIDFGLVIFFHGNVGAIFGIGYLIYDGMQNGDMLAFLKYTPMQYFGILIGCLADLTVTYSGLVAAQAGSQSFIGLIFFSTIIYAFFADFFIFGEDLKFKDVLLAGLMLTTIMGVSIYKMGSTT